MGLIEPIVIVMLSAYSGFGVAPSEAETSSLNAVQVDVMDRVFPDIAPDSMKYTDPVDVPRGGSIAFQFAVTAEESGTCEMSIGSVRRTDGTELACSTELFHLLPVPVEDNARPFGKRRPFEEEPPAAWLPFFIREAPFDIAEVLIDTSSFDLQKGIYHGVLVNIVVSSEAQPGEYTGELKLKLADEFTEVPFSFVVHETVVEEYALDSTNWFWAEPSWLTTDEPPAIWSEAHWKLIENSARTLREYGQNTIRTPFFRHARMKGDTFAVEPLIKTRITSTGEYKFDFTMFERWVELFLGQGFEIIEGSHLSTRKGIEIKEIYAHDERTGETVQLFKKGFKESKDDPDAVAWLKYLTSFMDALYAKLSERGWTSLYKQHLADEPYPDVLENYKFYKSLLNKHMPGIGSMDADWSEPAVFSPYMEVQVMALHAVPDNQETVLARKKEGLPTWLYDLNCAPPLPGRHLDRRLATSRVQPWMAFLYNIDGFLNWAANLYRGGTNPYETSSGPYCYPAGETWKFYPGPDGIRASMRMIAFRDGMLDHALLSKLGEKNRERADEIVRSIVSKPRSYKEDPSIYHAARKAILTALEDD